MKAVPQTVRKALLELIIMSITSYFAYKISIQACAQLGPVAGLTCTAATNESVKATAKCPVLFAPSTVDGAYTQNPRIDASYMLPIKNNTRQATFKVGVFSC